MRRRTLLQGLAASSLLAREGWAATAPHARKGVLIGGTKGTQPKTGQVVHGLSMIDLDAPATRAMVTLDFLTHGCALDPTSPSRALFFEKRGPHGVEIDLSRAAAGRRLAPGKGRAFYGHATFSRDGKQLFVVETDLATGKGVIAVLDGHSLAALSQLETHGEKPHDILLAANGKHAFITNGGGLLEGGDPASVTLVELASGKLVQKHVIPDERLNAGHVGVSSHGDLVVVSAPRDPLPSTEHGGLSLGAPGGPLTPMREPLAVTRAMRGETLSIAIHDAQRRVLVTNPDGNLVTAWDLANQQFIKLFDLPGARGIGQTLDGESFVVCHGPTADVSFISTKTLELDPAVHVANTLIAGSHVVVWSGHVAG